MKKIIISLTIVTTSFCVSTFGGVAEKTNPNPRALKTFESEFRDVTNVTWEGNLEITTASFNWNNFRVVAYFNVDGDLLITARNILFNQLPFAAINEVSKRFENATFYDIVEYTSRDETFYTLSVETASKRFKIKVFPSGKMSVEKSVKL